MVISRDHVLLAQAGFERPVEHLANSAGLGQFEVVLGRPASRRARRVEPMRRQ